MSRVKSKLFNETKIWKNLRLLRKRHATEAKTEMTRMLQLSGTDFKPALTKNASTRKGKYLGVNKKCKSQQRSRRYRKSMEIL